MQTNTRAEPSTFSSIRERRVRVTQTLAGMAGRGSRLFLADPSLISYSGHSYSYLRALQLIAQTHDVPTILLSNKGVDPVADQTMRTTPTFTYWIDHRASGNNQVNRAVHERALIQDLNAVHQTLKFRSDDMLLINSLRQWGLRGVLRWLEQLQPAERPFVVLVMHFTAYPRFDFELNWDELYQEFFSALERSSCRERLLLMADAEELIAEYRNWSNIPVLLAPIPHMPKLARTRGSRRPLTITYLGEARHNKGFDLLPSVVKRVRKDWSPEHVRFELMAFCYNPSQQFYVNAMASLRQTDASLPLEAFDERAYEALLASTDICLIPYRTENYHSQTSGVLAECVAAGALPVVPRGTWLARQVNEYRLGTCFLPEDCLDLFEATARTIAQFDKMKATAEAGQREFRDFHNAENFLNTVFAVSHP